MSLSVKQSVRNHVFHEITRSLCPECRRVVDAQVLIRDGAVYLRKHCPEHGWHEALVSSDAGWYLDSFKYNKPGAVPYQFAANVERGCPLDCGLCPERQQHTCVGIIEITRCNLSCSVCFADAGSGYDLSLEQVEAILDRLLQTEGQPEIVQISGGEPTIHPQVLDILAAARARGIQHLMLNTNGLRIAQAGLYATLVPTLVRGVNDGEIGDILRYGLKHPAVLGINYQPVTFAGRCLERQNPLDRITVTDVLHALEAQTEGLLRVDDFRPVPCPHPTCSACTYAFVDGDRVIPVTRLLDVDNYLDFVTNRSLPDLSAELQSALGALWSMAAAMGGDKTTDALNCVACNSSASLNSTMALSPEHFFAIQVHGFMDEHTFDLKRLMKCCVHQLLPDGRAVPFCAYNNLGYREQVQQGLEALP